MDDTASGVMIVRPGLGDLKRAEQEHREKKQRRQYARF